MVPGKDLACCEWVCRLQDHGFLASGVFPLLGEDVLVANSGFLEGRAGAFPLMGRAESWPSGGQGHVRDQEVFRQPI